MSTVTNWRGENEWQAGPCDTDWCHVHAGHHFHVDRPGRAVGWCADWPALFGAVGRQGPGVPGMELDCGGGHSVYGHRSVRTHRWAQVTR